MFSKDVGIDLGTANILIHVKNKGIVLNEPAIVTMDRVNNKVLAVGEEAYLMVGRTSNNIEVIRPLKGGVIADFDITEAMLTYFIEKLDVKGFLSKPRMLICCPTNITKVEKKAIKQAAEKSGAKEVFLEERSSSASGSTVVASMEGTRPVLVEIQALISPSSFGNPRRMATGVDSARVPLLMAVLEKRVGLMLQNQDAYIKVAGGVKLDEPAIDLAIAISIASSFKNQPTNPEDIFIGEVGLTGEIRRVSRIEQRVKEAAKLGFKRIICSKNNLDGWTVPKGIEVLGVDTVQEALRKGLGV